MGSVMGALRNRDPNNPLHDFRNYLYYTFVHVLKHGEPDPIQYALADRMQNPPVRPDGIARSQIQALRGFGKSDTAAALVTWLWYLDPTIRVCQILSNATKMEEVSSLVKQIVDTSPLLEHLRPDREQTGGMWHGKRKKNLASMKNTSRSFDIKGRGVGKDPSYAAYPVFGGWTGSHPDVIIADDVEIPENSDTPGKRHKLYNKLKECESLVLPEGYILYLGTPQTLESIYLKLEDAGYDIMRFPAELPDPENELACRNVAPFILNMLEEGGKPGDPSYPERFPAERLLEKKAMGLAYYHLQMLLDTTLSDAERYPLKLSNLIVFDTPNDMAPANIVWGTQDKMGYIDHGGLSTDYLCGPGWVDPDWQELTGKVMYIDPKGSGADSVGWAIGAGLNGLVYILDAGVHTGISGLSEASMAKLARTCATYEVRHVVVESNWGGSKEESAYAKLLEPILIQWNGPTKVELSYVKGQKEKRILDCLEPMINAHRIILSGRAARCHELTYQITHITRSPGCLTHDDAIDALYGVVNRFISTAFLDPATRVAEQRVEEAAQIAKHWENWSTRGGYIQAMETGKWDAGPRKARRKPPKHDRWKKC